MTKGNCENCKFAVPVGSSRTAEEWLEHAAALGVQCDKIQAEMDKASKSFWNWLPSPIVYDPAVDATFRIRSRQIEALAKAASIKNDMQCRRFPEAKTVKKTYCCGEYQQMDPMDAVVY